MASQKHVLEFSPNGKYFAVINNNGQLLIWDTETSELKQKCSISTNTNANCTALTWIQSVNPVSSKKKNNKRRSSNTGEINLFIAIGTSKGKVVLYSYAKGEIEYTFKGNGHTGAISGIFYDNANSLYTSGFDFNIIKWSISECNQVSSTKIGNETPYSLLFYPETQRLLTAGRQLKLWDMKSNELIETFTGHTSNIFLLNTFNVNGTDFALSGSASDRILSMWCLNLEQNQTNSVATFLMEDVAVCLSSVVRENILRIAAVTRSGVIHYYVEDFAKLKITKPIKPKMTLEIVSDSTALVEQIPSIAANLDLASDSILLCYGDKEFLRFESIAPSLLKRNQIEIRTDPRKIKKQKEKTDKESGTLIPIVDHEQVEYHNQSSFNRDKRINDLPMETRLENLKFVIEKSGTGKNMAQLLIQSLHSKDSSMLRTVFQCTEETTIKLTLQRLPPQYITPLVDELCIMMRKKTANVQIAVTWLKYLLQTHASQLMALGTTELFDRFGPCIGIIETRINNLQTLSRLRGRLDLLTSQLKNKKNDNVLQNPNLLVYEDDDSSKETSDIEVHDSASSDDQWEETDDEDNEQNNMEIDQNDQGDESDDDDDE